MVFPVIYTNVLNGIQNTDKNLLEMAQVFQVSGKNKIRYIYLSEVLPFFQSRLQCVAGKLCWKAGVAAEVIGIPDGSMGERLYEAKSVSGYSRPFCMDHGNSYSQHDI